MPKDFGYWGSHLMSGIGTGSGIGSYFGPTGTAIGALGGGLLGLVGGIFDSDNTPDYAGMRNQYLSNIRNQAEGLRGMANRLRQYNSAEYSRPLEAAKGRIMDMANFNSMNANREMYANGMRLNSAAAIARRNAENAKGYDSLNDFHNELYGKGMQQALGLDASANQMEAQAYGNAYDGELKTAMDLYNDAGNRRSNLWNIGSTLLSYAFKPKTNNYSSDWMTNTNNLLTDDTAYDNWLNIGRKKN